MEVVDISIIDDGVGMSEDKILRILDNQTDTNSGIGIRNTDHRLKQLYGKGLQIKSSPDQGTIITFQIPIKESINE